VKTEDGARLGAERLAAYLEGEVTTSEAEYIAETLRRDAAAQHCLEQLKQIRDALSAPVELGSLDIASRVEAALEAERGGARSGVARRGVFDIIGGRAGPWKGWLTRGVLLLGTAAAALLLVLSALEQQPDEFRAKSVGAGEREERRWAGIQVHRLSAEGRPERVPEVKASAGREPRPGEIHRSDRLVLSYTNGGLKPFEYLMIFGIDEADRVYWFYPSYESAGTNPASVAIAAGAVEAALPNAIEHDLSPGPFWMYGLFTHHPLHVDDVESWFARGADDDGGGRAPADGYLQVIRLQVIP
jgi:hypothetical protein